MVKEFVGPVYLEPIEHVYIHRQTGKRYGSVTQMLGSIEHEFETELVAERISMQRDDDPKKNPDYHGMTMEQILDYWQYLNDSANEYGTYVHETVETYLLKQKWWYPTDELQKAVIKAYNELEVDEGKCVYPERIMFSEKYSLAGTADLKIDIDDEWFDIGDWKGLPIDTPIFTNNGWKTMGSVSYGDKVYDMDGNLCDILHFSGVKNKDCFEIEFDNGEIIIADYEHRWLISFMRDGNFTDKVMTTDELFDYTTELNKSNKRWSHKIPKIKITKPLNNPNITLPLDPYLLGVWLGDGHKTDTKITNMNKKMWLELERRGYELGGDVSQGGSGKAQTRTVLNVSNIFNELNLIQNKHIPDIFLMASHEQRLDLLRGFMDTDGHYNSSRKRFVMSTTREWQANEFNKLVSSLGIKTTVIRYKKKAMGKIINVIDICFSTNNLNPFLTRDDLKIEYTKINNKTFKNIVSVKKVKSVPTRCIEVDSPSSTFLYGYNFGVTHNTNKRFEFYSPFGQTLKKPFNHLQQCHHSTYSLQLSVYAKMCEEETGMKCRQIWIGYWSRETEKFTRIPITYLKHEATQLLELHKYNKEIAT